MEKKWQIKKTNKSIFDNFKENMYQFTLMLWDGLGFFGTNHTKLGRLKGEKVNFMTRFKSPNILIMSLVGTILTLYIIIQEGRNIGEQKSQTISLIQ